ncbi:hypothetical protein GCM10014715_85320 [Streptomyces spiralis]|uniref:Uncharacterized protein n=1 Tax=Streptomyces spiralis TaxID=66376 RepID=A0A919AMM2_9ACTN|nr:hypothetical protein GCM10014715_85320 [Streptomyces spiralis]
MCFSTVARAFAATGFVKTTEIGMATPTVVPVCGVIVSNSIGGPAGFVGVGEALALGLPEAFASPPPALSLPPPPQALAPTIIATVTSAIPMPPLRRPTICPALSLPGPEGPDFLSDDCRTATVARGMQRFCDPHHSGFDGGHSARRSPGCASSPGCPVPASDL